MVVIGAVAALGGMPPDYFEDFITVRFTRGRPNDEQIITANIQALGLGFDEVTKTGFKVADLDDPPEETQPRVVIKGKRRPLPRRHHGGPRHLRRVPDFAGDHHPRVHGGEPPR